LSDEEIVKSSAFDYNPAVKAKTPSLADIDKVRSRTARSEYALGDTQKKLEARL
jgi:sterol carrier protein 2